MRETRTHGLTGRGLETKSQVGPPRQSPTLPGRRTLPDKGHFYAIARGSATECAAILDLLLARGFVSPPAYRHGRGLLIRVVQMLTRLVERDRCDQAR